MTRSRLKRRRCCSVVAWTGVFLFGTFTLLVIGLAIIGSSEDEYRVIPPITNIPLLNDVSEDVGLLLSSSVRILCLCITSGKYHAKRAAFIKATWAPRCTKTVFVSDKADNRLGAVQFSDLDGWSDLWAKTRLAYKWAHDNFLEDFDWFVKADDDTYLVVENLRLFLAGFDPNKPYYMGRHFRNGDDPMTLPKKELLVNYASGGSAYALSRNALKKLVEDAFQMPLYCAMSRKVLTTDIKEDIEMGRCLHSVGVSQVDTRDSQGRQRFNPFQPKRHLLPGGVTDDDWIRVHDAYRYVEGPNCCSDTAISFHYITGAEMLQLDYLLYRLRPIGAKQPPSTVTAEFGEVARQLRRNKYVIVKHKKKSKRHKHQTLHKP